MSVKIYYHILEKKLWNVKSTVIHEIAIST